MTKRRLGTIDLDTGEMVEEGVPVWIGKKPKFEERFFMAFQDAFTALSKDRDITSGPRRALDYLMGRLDFENFIQVSQAEITRELQMRQPNVSRAIKVLIEKKILLEGPKIGRSMSFRMNPRYGWKGKVRNLAEYQNKRGGNKLKLAVDNSKNPEKQASPAQQGCKKARFIDIIPKIVSEMSIVRFFFKRL